MPVEARPILISAIIAAVLAVVWSAIFSIANFVGDTLSDFLDLTTYEAARIDLYGLTTFIITILIAFFMFWVIGYYKDRFPSARLLIPLIFILVGLVMFYNVGGISKFILQTANVDDFYFHRITLGLSFVIPPAVFAFSDRNGHHDD